MENCSCDVFCPCLLGPRDPIRGFPSARPTTGRCDLPAVFHIEAGRFEEVVLDGQTVVLAIQIPGRMCEGDWRIAPYLPSAASEPQRSALGEIFLGRAGGPIARIGSVVSHWHEPRIVPIAYRSDAFRRFVEIPGILALEVEGVIGADGRSEIWIQNLKHMACRMMAAAVGRRGEYRDHGFTWNHAGKNGHYGPFEWTG